MVTMAELVEVIQADRDAAADALSQRNRADNPNAIRDGLMDQDAVVQAFARHRLATRPPASGVAEECAKIADKHAQRAQAAVVECRDWSPAQAEWSRARDLGLDIAEEIRALGEQANKDEGEGR